MLPMFEHFHQTGVSEMNLKLVVADVVAVADVAVVADGVVVVVDDGGDQLFENYSLKKVFEHNI